MNWFSSLAATGLLLIATAPVSAQTCTPLQVVGSQQTEVEKEVSIPSTGISRSNWNTDFVVPRNSGFDRYTAAILSRVEGQYQVSMSLKYTDKTVDTVYDSPLRLPSDQFVLLTVVPRPGKVLDQINLSVGGISAIGNLYTLGVSGCK
jgi:hypothetical protein